MPSGWNHRGPGGDPVKAPEGTYGPHVVSEHGGRRDCQPGDYLYDDGKVWAILTVDEADVASIWVIGAVVPGEGTGRVALERMNDAFAGLIARGVGGNPRSMTFWERAYNDGLIHGVSDYRNAWVHGGPIEPSSSPSP